MEPIKVVEHGVLMATKKDWTDAENSVNPSKSNSKIITS
jgi:hypothetical protein